MKFIAIIAILTSAIFLLIVKVICQSKEIKSLKLRLYDRKLPQRAICYTAPIIRFSVATKVDYEEGRHFSPRELEERVRRRLAEEASEKIMDFAMVESSEEESIIGIIKIIKAHFAIADMSGFKEPHFKEEK